MCVWVSCSFAALGLRDGQAELNITSQGLCVESPSEGELLWLTQPCVLLQFLPISSDLWEGWLVHAVSPLPIQDLGPWGAHSAILDE